MAKTLSSSNEADVEIAAGPGLDLPWTERRAWFQARLQQQPPSAITPDEIEAHWAHMPQLYWERVNESDLRWSLEAIHGFLQLMAAPNVPPTQPFVSWRQCQSSPSTRVMICTWDRQG